MPFRKYIRKFTKITISRIENVLGYSANLQRLGRKKRPSSADERVQEDWINRRKQTLSGISYQWLPEAPESFSPAQPLLTIRNPDLDPEKFFLTGEFTDDSDEESIEIDGPKDFFFPRPSSRLAQDLEEGYDEEFCNGLVPRALSPLPQGPGTSAEFYPEVFDYRAEYDVATREYYIVSRTSSEGSSSVAEDDFTPSPPATALQQDSAEHVAKRPERHVSWKLSNNLPHPGKHTFLQRMTDKLRAQASSRASSPPVSRSDQYGTRPPSPFLGSSHNPRSILKSSVGPPQSMSLVQPLVQEPGPSQLKTLVRKRGYRNLIGWLPIVTITPPDTLTPPPTTVLDFVQSPEHLKALPALFYRNPDRSTGLEFTDTLTIAERTESLTSHFNALDFAILSSTPIEPSTPTSDSSSESSVFETAPSSSASLTDSEEQVEARWVIVKAKVESLTKQLEHAKRELGEIEAVLQER